jgi:hypothetical protein
MTAPACRRGQIQSDGSLGFASGPLFDDDHLPATVVPATRADVVRALHLAAGPACYQVNWGDKYVPAAVALAMAADSLLGKCSHDVLLS